MANVVDLGLGVILAHQVHKHIMTAMNTSRSKLAQDALSDNKITASRRQWSTQLAVPNVFWAWTLRGPVLTRT